MSARATGTSRRRLLVGSLAAALAPACGDDPVGAPAIDGPDSGPSGATGDGLPTYTWDGPLGPEDTFAHGVASGDPLPDGVILWTRVSAAAAGQVEVFFEVATDAAFTARIAADWATTDASVDYTVHVDLTGLPAATTVYFRFSAVGRTSLVGRTRTAPAGEVDHLRLGVVSCSNYGYGFFHAYRHLAARADLDLVLHLGDYLYEYAMEGFGNTYGTLRPLDPPHEILTLEDYRRRYAWYRSDPDLREAHRQHPFVQVWDDHEFANDPELGGAGNHDPEAEGDWGARVAAALQAYTEWIPVRMGEGGRIFRALELGALARIVVLDRQRRYLWPAADDGDAYLGAEQAAWLDDQVASTGARWLVLAQGTRFTSRAADGVGAASWDATSRERVLDGVAALAATDLVVLAGDIHRMEALDVVRGPDVPSEGVELVCGSVTSPGSATDNAGVPHFHWTEADQRGYLVLDLQADRLVADWFGFADLLKNIEVLPAESFLAGYATDHGARSLAPTTTAAPAKANPPALAPEAS